MNSKMMQQEIFGPILPVLTFNDFNEVISIINNLDKPLVIYYFSK
jgi:aldehyde dehydrogenase (NAD+)